MTLGAMSRTVTSLSLRPAFFNERISPKWAADPNVMAMRLPFWSLIDLIPLPARATSPLAPPPSSGTAKILMSRPWARPKITG
jgi:hypothetical protein